MLTYVALLRGIGPLNPNMRNDKLRAVFEDLGFGDVRTVITTGNVIFESGSTDVAALETQIEAAWPERLGFSSCTIIRTAEQLQQLIDANPFGNLEHGPATSLDVTFLKRAPDEPLELPHVSDRGDYRIVAMVDGAVCSVIDRTAGGSPDLMRWLERRLGKQITTRTWTTVGRILQRLG